MTLTLLFASALRSGALGAIVWSALKMFRLRDNNSETIVWIVVLIASLLMPLMVHAVPAALHFPLQWPHVRTVGEPALQVAFVSTGHIINPSLEPLRECLGRLTLHWSLLLWCAYGVITLAGLARLSLGLVFTVLLYRESAPVKAPWAKNRRVRSSSRITGPVSCGACIILPADYLDWSPKKLAAVLAHEQAHLDRGDFFIQLLAALHRVFFWFSPFAWLLQTRLVFLAEAASDEAAVRILNDRVYYAEILLEMSQKAQGAPVLVAMTKHAGIQRRILQILDEALPAHPPSGAIRFMLVAAILPLAGLLAGARANIPSGTPEIKSAVHFLQNRLVEMPIIQVSPKITVSQIEGLPVPAHGLNAPAREKHASAPEVAAAPSSTQDTDPDDITYNPRALLQSSSAAIVSTIIPVTPDEQRKVNRSAPALLDLRSDDHNTQ